jgi:hypothetical protein
MKLFSSPILLLGLAALVKTAVVDDKTSGIRTTNDEYISPVDERNIETYFSSVASYCPARKLCENVSTEIGRWECLGESLFFARTADNYSDALNRFERFVVSDCGGVGFGNAIRGYYAAVGIAAALGRRMVVEYGPMQRMFLPPYGDSWDYALELRVMKQRHEEVGLMDKFHYKFMNTEHFDFEAHGRSPGRFLAWSNSLKSSSLEISAYAPEPDIINQLPEPWKQYSNKPLLNAGICGGEREMLTTGSCLPEILTKFVHCVTGASHHTDRYQYLQEFELSIPFYFSLFRRPGPKMLKVLRTIRKRIGKELRSSA